MPKLSMQPIQITVEEDRVQQTLDFVAKMQHDKFAKGVTDRIFDVDNTSDGIHVVGHLGEQAVAQLLDLDIDTTVLTSGDVGHDLVWGGTTIQVKTSELRKLIFNAKHLFSADVAILAQFIGENKAESQNDPQFRIWGWISRKEFIDNYYAVNFGYGTRLVVDGESLHTLDSLAEEVADAQV